MVCVGVFLFVGGRGVWRGGRGCFLLIILMRSRRE
jgi:hypothetical protein